MIHILDNSLYLILFLLFQLFYYNLFLLTCHYKGATVNLTQLAILSIREPELTSLPQNIEKLFIRANKLLKLPKKRQVDLNRTLTYFKNNLNQMNYAAHINQNLPIGSGVTEAACKTLVKQRLSGSGMCWKKQKAL